MPIEDPLPAEFAPGRPAPQLPIRLPRAFGVVLDEYERSVLSRLARQTGKELTQEECRVLNRIAVRVGFAPPEPAPTFRAGPGIKPGEVITSPFEGGPDTEITPEDDHGETVDPECVPPVVRRVLGPPPEVFVPGKHGPLRHFFWFALGDRRLSPWEESFLKDLNSILLRLLDRLYVTRKQAAKLNQIAAKLGYEMDSAPPPPDDLAPRLRRPAATPQAVPPGAPHPDPEIQDCLVRFQAGLNRRNSVPHMLSLARVIFPERALPEIKRRFAP